MSDTRTVRRAQAGACRHRSVTFSPDPPPSAYHVPTALAELLFIFLMLFEWARSFSLCARSGLFTWRESYHPWSLVSGLTQRHVFEIQHFAPFYVGVALRRAGGPRPSGGAPACSSLAAVHGAAVTVPVCAQPPVGALFRSSERMPGGSCRAVWTWLPRAPPCPLVWLSPAPGSQRAWPTVSAESVFAVGVDGSRRASFPRRRHPGVPDGAGRGARAVPQAEEGVPTRQARAAR